MAVKGGISDIIAGAALEASAVAANMLPGIGQAVAPFLAQAGAGLIIQGIGSIIQGNQLKPGAFTTKTPIGIYTVEYGERQAGGTLVFDNTWGNNLAMRDLVIVLAAHPISTITRLQLDNVFVQMNVPSNPTYAFAPTPLTPCYSTGPVNGNYNISSISRSAEGVVTVVTTSGIPFLEAGDQISIHYASGGSGTLTSYGLVATWQVSQIITVVGGFVTSFQFLSGGPTCLVNNQGQASTVWPNYGNNIYAEWSRGEGIIGQQGGTFVGMVGGPVDGYTWPAGTPWLGSGASGNPAKATPVNPASPGNAGGKAVQNPWTAFCSLQGLSAVFLRLTGTTTLFPHDLPLVSFIINGKSDIYDPRLGPCTGIEAGGFASNGSGYQAGDLLSVIQGGTTQTAWIQIVGVSPTGVLSWKIQTPPTWPASSQSGVKQTGEGYTVGGPYPTTGGSGTGATFMVSELGGSTGTIVYTANSALCIADFLNDPDWGYDIPYSDTPIVGEYIPTAELITAANICDESVATVVGGSEPLWSCNGKFDLSQSRGEILDQMLTSCAGRLTTFGGQYIIWPATWYGSSPVSYDFIANAAGAGFEGRPFVQIKDLFNGVRGTYISPANKWQSTDFPYYAQDYLHNYNGPAQYMGDINLAADGGQRRWFDMQLKFTISSRQAQQTAKIELLRRRNFGTWNFTCNMSAYQFTPMDIIAGTNSFLGWSGYLLEAQQVRFSPEKIKGAGGAEAIRLTCEIDVQQTNSDIYAWSTAEELTPQGYQQVFWPQANVTEQSCLPWSPGYLFSTSGSPPTSATIGAAPGPGDAVYPSAVSGSPPILLTPGPATFGVQPIIGTDASGGGTVSLQFTGYCPINAIDTEIDSPQISVTGALTGGYLPDGTYAIGLAGRDSGSSNYKNTNYLQIGIAYISGGGGNGSINVTILWGSGDAGADLYIAELSPGTVFNQFNDTSYTWHWNQFVPFSSGSPPVENTTATVTIFDQSQPGGPDPNFDHFGVTWREVIHSGIWADTIVSVTSNTITIGAPAGITANQFAGYVMTLLGKFDQTVPIPILNLAIASHTATSSSEVVYTIGPNSAGVQPPDLTTLLNPNDLMVVRFKATFTANSFTDPNINNPYFPSGANDVEVGYVAIVLTGVDAGDVQTVSGVSTMVNPNDTFLISGAWATTPNAGDIVIVCTAALAPQVASPAQSAPNKSVGGIMATVPVPNLASQTWLFLVRTISATGAYGPDSLCPMRDIYMEGAPGSGSGALITATRAN